MLIGVGVIYSAPRIGYDHRTGHRAHAGNAYSSSRNNDAPDYRKLYGATAERRQLMKCAVARVIVPISFDIYSQTEE